MKLLLIGAFFAIFSDAYGNSSYVRKSPYNITGKWFLPNPTSTVFYLHFRDRISWIEADAVCQFHHSQLVTVNSADQFSDLKSYLQELFYDDPVWIGLRRSVPQGPFKWIDNSVFLSDHYWKIKPAKDEKLCVESSPSDDFLWTARQCNGPDIAAFICEMPVPKWVTKSSCMKSVDSSITVTFHPEKSMIKAGRVCQNSDVKYIECHASGKEEKLKENMAQHLNCFDIPLKREYNFTASLSTITVGGLTKKASTKISNPVTLHPIAVQKISSSPHKTLTSTIMYFSDYNMSSDSDIYDKNAVILEASSESSTISLPQEMSFAEEPIKASKSFLLKEPTEKPYHDGNGTNDTILAQHKSNVNTINLIPTSQPQKIKPEIIDNVVTEQAKESVFSTYSLTSTTSSLYNSTPFEESHEIFNNDKDRESFQDLSPTKKSNKIEEIETSSISLKNILSKSSESDEEEQGDRTYNIEGTFDSNDFANAEPINVNKKIDLAPLENVNRDTTTSAELEIKSTTNSILRPFTQTTQSAQVTQTPSISLTSSNVQVILNSTVTTLKRITTASTDKPHTLQVNITSPSTEKPELRQQRISALLSGAEENINENLPNRKRRIINSERHSFYPYFLGRILG